MKIHPSKTFQFIIYILTVSSCLQGCTHFTLPPTPIQHIDNSSVTYEQLVDKSLLSKQGHKVNFYQENGQLHAFVEENLPQGFSRSYLASVIINPTLNLTIASINNLDWQKKHVHVVNDRVYIARIGVLLGGGKEKDIN